MAEKIIPEAGKMYRNKSGGTFRCMSVTRDGSAVMCNMKSGWTCTAHGVTQYASGDIEWDYSNDGRFDASLHLQAQIDALDKLHDVIAAAAADCPCIPDDTRNLINALLGKLHSDRWAKMWERAAEGGRTS